MLESPSRRALLHAAATAATLLPWPRWAQSQPRLLYDPFALGVASGILSAHGVVLWTRLVGASPFLPPAARGDLAVRWELAEDDGFRRVLRRGTAVASAALGWSVRAELRDLPPDRWLHYRFLLGDAVSATGRTRTAPPADADAGRLRLVFASCQRWEHGYYAAWRHAAAEQPDLVLFLGDYIYEYASPPPGIGAGTVPVRTHALRHAVDLADYRDRYAMHRSDPDLQAAHAACPWLVTWDDHEVENDYAGDRGRNAGQQATFLQQRSAAYQAFWENMPLPASVLLSGLAHGGATAPAAWGMALHHRLRWGRLATLHVLDTRQHRDVQACRVDGTGSQPVDPQACAEWADPHRTLLGRPQERWLDQGLADDAASGIGWSILAQQTLLSPRRPTRTATTRLVSSDAWDGYPAARQRLLDAVSAQRAGRTVVLGGDIHQNFVCEVPADAEAPDGQPIAVEFCGTSITSHSSVTAARLAALQAANPHVRFADAAHRGYGLCEVDAGRWATRLQVVEDGGRAVDAAVRTLARFEVAAGRARMARV